jgi:type II secretory pathway component PulJ
MVVAIVFLGVIASVITALIKAMSERHDRKHDSAGGEADELRDHIVTLEERIRVLERIITDSSGREDLRRQFRDLEG